MRLWLQAVLIMALALTACRRPEYKMLDSRLKIVPLDTDAEESYLGLAIDGAGRMFVGGREALFVYEPAAHGHYKKRQELLRFPPDTWIYNIALRGPDLYLLTASALYIVPGGVAQRQNLHAQKLLWGFPDLQCHAAMHGLTFGPDGDLYISMGDPVWYQVNFGRPDHWTHWTFHHGPADATMPYVGTGGVLRMSPDGRELSVYATGTRNDCGLAFDAQWNLFGPDNDHEQNFDEFVPGRLLHITEHAYFNWPRGWMTEKQPWRADLLQTMTPHLGRYVPVGLCYYNDEFLPAEFRNSLYVARWGVRTIPRYPLEAAGDTFRTEEAPFLKGADESMARPVNVVVGRSGRMFGVVCYMPHNDGSPHYKSDLFMITTAEDPSEAPFRAFDETKATSDELFAELETPSWERRFRAHVELTRREPAAGAEAARRLALARNDSRAMLHLIWLAAAQTNAATRATLIGLTHNPVAAVRLNAVRALARFGAGAAADEVFGAALDDPDAPVRLAGLAGLIDHGSQPPWAKVEALAEGTLDAIVEAGTRGSGLKIEDWDSPAWQTAGQSPHWENSSYERQAAAFLLRAKGSPAQWAELCEDPDPRRRILGILAVGFRLTKPEPDQPPSRWVPKSSVLTDGTNYFGADLVQGRDEDQRVCAAAGTFSTQAIWLAVTMTDEEKKLVALLEHRLLDGNKNVARQALFFLRLIRNREAEQVLATEWGLARRLRSRRALPNFRAATATNLPAAFREFDWAKEAAAGNPQRGHEMFLSRGCNRCHSIAAGDGGSGGPSLAGAGSRFNVPYLAESVMAPNAVVSPLFRWTALQLTGGEEINGLVVNETSEELTLLLPSTERRVIRQDQVESRQVQNRSPMPEGLINTPADLRDLLAFLTSLR
ncbi:MAG TPA: hypothetical protein VHB20_12215 [Verrucomicrobiae bacterium]|jgi:putative heme-binding domain-containing protein|nr:hypothetical protein [Verrucomicrobiae bacterium]